MCIKKLLLTIILIGFTSLSANATYEVNYGMGGQMTSISHGFYTTHSVNNFGSNALFLPQNTNRGGYGRRYARPGDYYSRSRCGDEYMSNHDIIMERTRMRQAYMGNRMYNTPNIPPTNNSISRLDKNYTPSGYKTISSNGIIYYNR